MTLLEYAKAFPGVEIHGKSIRIRFIYKGVERKETLKGVSLTETNLKFAFNKRTVILYEITTQTFNYLAHFPESKAALTLSCAKAIPTVAEALAAWLEVKATQVRKKSVYNYRNDSNNHILPKFAKRKLDSIKHSEIEAWRSLNLGHLSNKTINDVCTPFRGIFDSAMADRIIDHNPFSHIKNLERDSEDNADPFDMSEITLMANYKTDMVSEQNGILFAIWCGVRVSEWLALAWEDIDVNKREIRIRRSVVRGEYAYPKTAGSYRTIHLLDQAWEFIERQRAISSLLPSKQVEVIGKDNRKKQRFTLTFVFVSSRTSQPYINSARVNENFFAHFLKVNKIRYRGVNQARHTFASQLLTKGVAERWIMREMGHTSIVTFEKHYGRWIDAEMPDMAKNVSDLFRFRPTDAQRKLGS